jgi:hypothetical protein
VLGLAQMFEEKVREGKAAEAAGKKDSKKDDKGKKK